MYESYIRTGEPTTPDAAAVALNRSGSILQVWDHVGVQSPLLDISAALLSIGQALDDYFNSRIENAEPFEGSTAEEERRSPIGAVEAAGTLFTAGWVWTTLGIPSDHLQAASRLIQPQYDRASVNRFAILSLLRVALEVSSLCWWLVNPKITARERMQRTLRLQRWSLDHVDRRDRYLLSIDERSQTQNLARDAFQTRIDDLAEEHNLQKIRSGSREIPDASDLIGKQFQATGIADDARNIYAQLSEVTHGNMFGTLAGYTRPGERDQTTGPGVPLWLICVGAYYSAFGFCDAVETYIRFMGWDERTWAEATFGPKKVLETIARLVNASEAARQSNI